MSDYVNEYVESAKEVLASAAKKVVEKSSEIYNTTKLTYEISKLRDEMNKCYKELGEMFYANYMGKDTSMEDAEAICEKINQLKKDIDKVAAEIAFVKGNNVCENCGAEVTKESVYCARCGKEL